MDVLVTSDFNADLISRCIAADATEPPLAANAAPYGQVFQTLAAAQPANEMQALFIWARPEGVIASYRGLLEGESIDPDTLLAEVDQFANAIASAAQRYRLVLIASFVRAQAGRGSGLMDWTDDGEALWLARMNVRLVERLRAAANVRVLDAQRWLDSARPPRDARYWYTMKSPFPDAVLRAAARDIKAATRAFSGSARKLVVLDLDDTLWGGVVGETGWAGVRLGGHDAIGEAYVDFQRALKTLSRRGVALAIVSKNTEAVALEAIDQHPEMILRRADLAGWRINWQDKAQNLVELAAELNLGLQSVVFIDDNPAERGRVAEALPEVMVPDWPVDPLRYADALRQLDCFDTHALTAEDRSRADMYAKARERNQGMAGTSMEDWLAALDVQVSIEPALGANLTRSVQLANKTNQMNLRSRRMTEVEFSSWIAGPPTRQAWAIKVSDRFGDLGLTGLLSCERTDSEVEVVDFLLSCRAMGRQVENVMAHLAVEWAREIGAASVIAPFAPTERNQPCRDFWEGSGFEREGDIYRWNAARPYPRPDFISVHAPAAAEA